MTPEFLLTSFIVIVLPGTGVIYTLAIGLGRGWSASALAAVGCTLGIVPHIAASLVGLAALLHASALAFQIVKFLGVAYLIYMAVQVLREGGALSVDGDTTPRSGMKTIVDGILLNVLNPKLSVFFLAFLPQFVPADAAAPTILMLGLAGVFMVLTFLVFLLYGACAAAARDYVIARPRVMTWLRRSFAGAFALLSLRLATAER